MIWISVEEKLPAYKQVVIATDGNSVHEMRFYGDYFEGFDGWCFPKAVTHWMPMPKLPSDGEKVPRYMDGRATFLLK